MVTLSQLGYTQTVIWTEDFGAGCSQGTVASTYSGTNGAWAITATGVNDPEANQWYVSAMENGNAAGACGTGCGTDRSLHVGNSAIVAFGIPADNGAAYNAGGACGTFFCVATDRRVESPTINLTGFSTITLNFNYMESLAGNPGADPSDDATLWYFDGAVWAQIDPLALTSAGCDPQGTWTAFSIPLPASADNNPNVKIGFRWVNDDDGAGIDPTFAVDDITLTVPVVGAPTASFTTPITTICVGTCIDFTNTSTGGPFTATDWIFTGATPATSAVNNPTNICYNTAGTYAVELSVTDANGTDVENIAGYITVVDNPDGGADNAADLCNNTTLDLNTLLSGADPGGTWAETTGTPSGQFTPGTGVLDGNGLPLGPYTFTYTVNATAPCVGNDFSTFTITIIDCSAGTPPTAAFTPSQTTICAGDCITFTDNSTPGDITNWGWDFGGGATPNNFVGQDPGSVCFNTAGTYTVTLGVTNPFGNDNISVDIQVNPAPMIIANAAPSNSVCAGDQVTLTGSGAVSYNWTGGVSDGVAFTPAASGNYTVTGTDANGCENTANIFVTVTICEPMVAGFSYDDNICAGDCITLTDTTTGVPISWNWDFGGGASPNTSTDQSPVVCFNSPGTFDIQLTTEDAGGNISSTTNSITVFGMPTVYTEFDTIVEIGHAASLNAYGSAPGSYWWTPDEGDIDCDTCSSTLAYPLVTTDFVVYFTDENGCMAQDTLLVLVNFIEGIGVPQAFSPNGDGQNDVLYVKGFGIEQIRFSVYNRYGQKVFETTDQKIGWDGMFNNREENPGVFVWVLEYTLITGKGGLMTGNTTLIR